MICSLRIRVAMTRGALVRVIRLVEHRSSRILSIEVHGDAEEGGAVIVLTAEGKVPKASLAQQIGKLYDVREVTVVGEPR